MTTPTVDVPFDRYHDFEAMTAHLKALAAAFPKMMRLDSIGTSHRGRDIWAVTLTNSDTGPEGDKPGYYLDAQIHAEEHATSAVALYAVWHLLHAYGNDEEVTLLLDRQVFYVLPRINPDGAEFALQPPYVPWCGNGRCLPGEERETGLVPEDVDGDGFITTMRVPDPKGEWKKSTHDPRLMVQRAPGEEGGDYYRLYPEGRVRDYDGVHVVIEKPRDGNLNRNFPANWSNVEYGAFEAALSEPESRAVARFILDRPNIAGMNALHTHGGIILRPSMTQPDATMPPRDLALYEEIGKVGEALTGYPTVSIYEEFTPDKSEPRHGGLMDWTYEQMGIVSFGTELWDLEGEAGVDKTAYYNLHPRDEETQAKVFEWVLAHVGDEGFRAWTPLEHPELGPVEVGGMVYLWTYRNPPPKLLEAICHDNVRFCIRHALAAPRVAVDEVRTRRLAEGVYEVRTVVANHGYLPTNLTDVALERGLARPVTVTLRADPPATLETDETVRLGHLAGRNERRFPWSPWGPVWTANAVPARWIVRAPEGHPVEIDVRSERGGVARARARLGTDA